MFRTVGIKRRHRRSLATRWLAIVALGAALLGLPATSAMADDPVPDKTGAYQTTPTPVAPLPTNS